MATEIIKIKKHAYDKDADAVYFEFSDRKVYKSKELKDGIIADYDKNGLIVGVEILDVSKKKNITFKFVELPKSVVQFSAGKQEFRVPVAA